MPLQRWWVFGVVFVVELCSVDGGINVGMRVIGQMCVIVSLYWFVVVCRINVGFVNSLLLNFVIIIFGTYELVIDM